MNKKEALFLPATLILICIVFIVTMEGGTKRKKSIKRKHKKSQKIKTQIKILL
jgi:hypothetical protein